MRIPARISLLWQLVQLSFLSAVVVAADGSSQKKSLRQGGGDNGTTSQQQKQKEQRQLLSITPPIDMTEMAEFAITLTPTIETTLKTVLSEYDPYRLEETITQTFKNVNIQGFCTLDITADITLKSITGISSLEITSLSISNGATLQAVPKFHWKGDFTFDAKFSQPIVTLADIRVQGNGCFGAINIDETVSDVQITLTDPTTMNLQTFVKGHLDTMSQLVSVEEAQVNAMDLQVTGATVSGLGATLEQYVPDLSTQIQTLIKDGIDTHVEPVAEQAINTMLDSALPVALSV